MPVKTAAIELPQPSPESPARVADGTRSRKASLNTVAATLDYGVRLLTSFVVKPILLSGLGAYGYGAWEVLERLAGYLSPATGRSGHALRWTIAHGQSSRDEESKRRTVGDAAAVWIVLLPACLLLTFGLAWQAPRWLDTPDGQVWPLRLAMLVLGGNVALMSLVEIPRSVLEGENLGYKRMGLSAILVALGGAFTATAVWLQLGLPGVAAAAVATTCLTGLLYLRVVRTQVDWFGIERPTVASLGKFFRLSGWFLSWNGVTKLLRASDVVVLGIFASVELVASYSLTRYAPEVAINLVAAVVFGITPGLGGIIGAGQLRKAASIREEMLALTWLIATVAGTTTLIWNHTFLHLWIGDDLYAGSVANLLLVVMVTQFVLLRTDGNVIDLTLQLRGKVLCGFAAAAAAITLSALFVGVFDWGIEGLCLGIIVGRLLLTFAYPYLVGRHLRLRWERQLTAAARPLLASALCFALAIRFGAERHADHWAGLIVGVAATLVVAPLPIAVLGLAGTSRERLLKRLKAIVDRQGAARRER